MDCACNVKGVYISGLTVKEVAFRLNTMMQCRIFCSQYGFDCRFAFIEWNVPAIDVGCAFKHWEAALVRRDINEIKLVTDAVFRVAEWSW